MSGDWGYPDTPYSKKLNKNLVRFWAEVFLLAQEGAEGGKWELCLPKLVPVNVARVQDSPSFLSHVTAYNTKVEKVLDALISYPDIDIYRGSPCFVYWADISRGLTWGLNFLTPQDADGFVSLVVRVGWMYTKVEKVLDALISYPDIDIYRGSPCFVYWADISRGLTWGLNFLTPQDADGFVSLVVRVGWMYTKVEKVLDALISYPDIDIYRGSPCFVYWADISRGLTWGLNFLTPQDADGFVSLVVRVGWMCTKVEKVLDALISYPDIDIYRGSPCFVYWADISRGLTWGLNFLTPQDADGFVSLVVRVGWMLID